MLTRVRMRAQMRVLRLYSPMNYDPVNFWIPVAVTVATVVVTVGVVTAGVVSVCDATVAVKAVDAVATVAAVPTVAAVAVIVLQKPLKWSVVSNSGFGSLCFASRR